MPCGNIDISFQAEYVRKRPVILRVFIWVFADINIEFEIYGAKMKSIQTLLAWTFLASSLGMPAAVPASLKITIASEVSAPNPTIHITFRNLQARPLRINCSGAFFDYEIRLTNSNGHPVRMTKEASDIRSGRGLIVMSATMVTLNQNELQQEDLDLARYFDLSTGEPYTLVLVRALAGTGQQIASNSLVIGTK